MINNTAGVTVTIRGMNGQFAAFGVELDGGNPLVPKLKPSEVVTLPGDWPLNTCDALEITHAQATRPFAFESTDEVAAYLRGERRVAGEEATASASTQFQSDVVQSDVEGATAANAYIRRDAPEAHTRRADGG